MPAACGHASGHGQHLTPAAQQGPSCPNWKAETVTEALLQVWICQSRKRLARSHGRGAI
jgi:hypothetical protein